MICAYGCRGVEDAPRPGDDAVEDEPRASAVLCGVVIAVYRMEMTCLATVEKHVCAARSINYAMCGWTLPLCLCS